MKLKPKTLLAALVAIVLLYGAGWLLWVKLYQDAQVANNSGRRQEAETLLKTCLALSWLALPGDPRRQLSEYTLASTYVQDNKPAEAQALFEKLANSSSTGLIDRVDVMIGLGAVCTTQYRPDLAVPVFLDALKYLESRNQMQSDKAATILEMVAKTYRDQAKTDEALPYFKRSIGLREKLYGAHSRQTITALHDLAHSYLIAGDVSSAEETFRDALQRANSLKDGGTEWQFRLHNDLAALAYMRGNDKDGSRLLHETLPLANKGIQHPSVSYCYWRIGTVFARQNDLKRAQPLFALATKLSTAANQTDEHEYVSALHCYQLGKW